MKRFSLVAALTALLLVLFAPTAVAAEPGANVGQALVAINRNVDIPSGDHLDTLVVVSGDATISGDVRTIVVLNGTATLSGATAETLVVLDGSAALQAGTTVSGDVRTFHGTVTQEPGATVGGSVEPLDVNLAALGVLLIPAFILFFIGLVVAALVAALLVAAFAARQVRGVETIIAREPVQSIVAGVVGTIALPIVGILLVMTIVGAPVGLGVLVVVLPALAFLSWVVAAIMVGDWLVARRRGAAEPDRPYVAAIVGVIVLGFLGLFPFVSTIATLFGAGGLLIAAWRVLRREGLPTDGTPATPVGPVPGTALGAS